MNLVLPVAALFVGAALLVAQDPPKPPATVPAKPIRLVAPTAPAQEPSQDELKQKRADKLAKPVFQKAPWLFDYDAAKAQAKKEGKLVLAYFTRSYAH